MTSLLLALLLFGSHGPQVKRVSVKPWVLTVSRDRFTGAVTCTAAARGARVDGDRVTLDLGRYVEITQAVYRFDGGPALKLSALHSDAGYRESFHFNPDHDGNKVFFKVSDLAGVQTVWVRADDKHAPARFDVAALPRLIDAEGAQGCPAP